MEEEDKLQQLIKEIEDTIVQHVNYDRWDVDVYVLQAILDRYKKE